jgi:S-methylmethionine-dependent homocysteine/selenocysteine methylase
LPEQFDAVRAPIILAELAAAQAGFVDFWLAETLSSIADLEAAVGAAAEYGKPIWAAFCLADGPEQTVPRLRSGETLVDAALRAAELGCVAVLINCTRPELIGDGVKALIAALSGHSEVRIGAYPNSFEGKAMKAVGNDSYTKTLMSMKPISEDEFLGPVREWVKLGASIIGGCCGIYPEHIAMLAAANLSTDRMDADLLAHAVPPRG